MDKEIRKQIKKKKKKKTDQEKWHNLWETKKQNAARVAFSATLNQHFIDQELYLIFFLAFLSASVIFFFLFVLLCQQQVKTESFSNAPTLKQINLQLSPMGLKLYGGWI